MSEYFGRSLDRAIKGFFIFLIVACLVVGALLFWLGYTIGKKGYRFQSPVTTQLVRTTQ